MYLVFARKYRPMRFEGVVGQQHIARTLQNAVRADRVAHAYLFCGSRGVGKTSMARILAKALNCKDGPTPAPCCECESCRRIAAGNDLDVMEIDGASNRGIDEVRQLRQNVRLVPAHSRVKIYYIDEVHMLTTEAFNALLKTLEEPPPHVKFIFSTTDPQRMPETVKSRCQRFDFRRISDGDIIALLERICGQEGLTVEEGGLAAIARAARGSMRDALGTLDQLAALGKEIATVDVLAVLGAVDRRVLAELVDAMACEDTAAALRGMHRAIFGGVDVEDLADQLSQYLRDLLVARHCGADDPMLAGAAADRETLERQSAAFTPEQLTYMIQVLREAKLRARGDTAGRLALELAVVKLSRLSDLVPLEEALGKMDLGAAADPGSAPAGRVREAPAESGAPSYAGNPIAKIRARLKDRSSGGGEGSGAQAVTAEAPEGMSDVTVRKIMACADDPETARRALRHEALMKAFVEGDKALGLDPVRLEEYKRTEREEDSGTDEPAEETN